MLSPVWRKWLSSLFRSTNRHSYRKPRLQRRKSTKLQLEGLEDRYVPASLVEGAHSLTLDLQGDIVFIAGNTTSLVFTDESAPITVTGSTWTTAGSGTFTVTVNGTTSPNLNTLTINDSFGTGAIGFGDGINAVDLSLANTTLVDGGASNPSSTDFLNPVSTGAGNQTYNTTVLPENPGITLTGNTVTFNADVLPADEDLTVVGNTVINANDFNTGQGNQTFDGPVSLGADATLTGNTVTFGSTVDDTVANTDNLTINGTVVFDGDVGVTTPLHTLAVNGNTTFNAPTFNTCSTQTYNGPVSLETGVTLNANGATVEFDDTVDSLNSTGRSLSVFGNAVFDGNVGETNQLSNLTVVNAATVNTALVNTTGNQNYCGPVSVDSDVDFCTTGAATITFDNTVNGGHNATVEADLGNATFCNAVGGSTALESLTVNTGSASTFEGNVTTSGNQTYEGAVNVTNTVVFKLTTGSSSTNVTFGSSLNGGNAVTVDIAGASRAFFNGSVGDSTALSSLTVNGGSDVNGNITTSGNQTYNGVVDLFNTVLFNATTGGNVTFCGTLLGGNDMTVDTTTGNTVFSGIVNEDSLTVNGSNHAVLNSTVSTYGDQTYNEAVSLTGNATLTGTTVTFDGNVSGTNESLKVDGNTVLSAGSVNTGSLGNQAYNGGVLLTANTTLTGNTVTFDGALFAGSNDLTIAGSGTFNGTDSNLGNLAVSGNFTIGGGTFTAPGSGNAFDVGGDWDNTGGTFDPNGGTVTFDGTTQTIDGNNTFNNLSDTTAGATLTFQAGDTQTINGTLTLQGASGNLLSLRSPTTPEPNGSSRPTARGRYPSWTSKIATTPFCHPFFPRIRMIPATTRTGLP